MPARSLVLPAPAKLNLFLHVTGRRSDGYHQLQTLFQLLDWGDEVTLSVRDDGRIERSHGLADVAPDDDLAIRAARALQQATGTRLGAGIGVDKRIPAGAGLGGGSSDAATVLLGLNHLWETGVDRRELARIGLALGADVPVFIGGRSGFGEGVGEQLTPLDLPERRYVLIWPGIGVATGAIFQAPELTRNTPPLKIADLPGACVRNDLQPVAIRQCPAIADALSWLRPWGEARMSGSGSAVFLEVPDRRIAETIVNASPWPAWSVSGTNVSPLHRALGLAA